MSTFENDLEAFRIWWIDAGDKPRASGTASEYVRHIRRWHDWELERDPSASGTPTMRGARAYLAELRKASRWQAFMSCRALKSWSKFLVQDGSADTDPLASLKYEREPETSKTPVASLEDIDKLLATCNSDSFIDVRDRAMIMLLRATGMRRGELVATELRDYDFTANTLHLRPDVTKTGRARTIGFDAETELPGPRLDHGAGIKIRCRPRTGADHRGAGASDACEDDVDDS